METHFSFMRYFIYIIIFLLSAKDAYSNFELNKKKQNIIPYLIFGEKDATVGPYLEERISLFREACKDVRIHVEIDAGHWIMYEKPDRFNNLIKEIIN